MAIPTNDRRDLAFDWLRDGRIFTELDLSLLQSKCFYCRTFRENQAIYKLKVFRENLCNVLSVRELVRSLNLALMSYCTVLAPVEGYPARPAKERRLLPFHRLGILDRRYGP